jgi:virginiamycin B lyase
MAVVPDAVWVTSQANGTLTRIDPKTNKPGTSIAAGPAGSAPCQPAVMAFRSLWVALCRSKQLLRLDVPVEKSAEKPGDKPTEQPTEKPPTEKPADKSAQKLSPIVAVQVRNPGPLATGTGSIWMITDTNGTLARIDPDTNAVVAEIAVPSGVSAMTLGMNALWIASSSGGSVTRVNAATNVVEETIKVGRGPVSVAFGEGSVWTMNGGDGTVSRIDPKTNKVIETIKSGVAGTSGTIVVGEGSVWLSASGIPLTRIDPSGNRMVQQFSGPGGGLLAIGHKSLWLGAAPTAIWRIDPKRVEATRK